MKIKKKASKNLQSKTTAKQIKATSKRLSATAKKSASNKASKKQLRELRNALTVRIQREQKQLEAIEKLLDEDFVSLAQAKRELKRNTVQVKRTSKAAIKATRSFAKLLREAFTTSNGKPSKATPSQKRQSSKPVKKQTSKPAQGKSSERSSKLKISTSVVPPVKQPTKTPPKKQLKLSTRSLKGKKSETTLQLFDRLQGMGDSPDSLLGLGERWTFTYGKGRAKRLYGSFQQAVDRMHGYRLTQSILDGDIEDSEFEHKFVTSITITKTGERPGAYADKKEAEEKMRENERRAIRKAARKQLEESGQAPPSIFGGSIDIVSAQNKLIEKLQKQLKKKGKKK